MRIRIDRAWRKSSYTISRVFINGERFGDGKNWCNVLEDTDRGLRSSMTLEEILSVKVPGQTAIPRGIYQVIITYSPKFKKRLPLLQNVPGFSGIRIHSGNKARDTEGCLLPGINNEVGRVNNSRYWTEMLCEKIDKAIQAGEKVWVEIG